MKVALVVAWMVVIIVIVGCAIVINAVNELEAQCEAEGGHLARSFGWWVYRCVPLGELP